MHGLPQRQALGKQISGLLVQAAQHAADEGNLPDVLRGLNDQVTEHPVHFRAFWFSPVAPGEVFVQIIVS